MMLMQATCGKMAKKQEACEMWTWHQLLKTNAYAATLATSYRDNVTFHSDNSWCLVRSAIDTS